MRTLYLLRHAHAEPGSSRQDDAARHLDMRGRREAAAMCAYLLDHERVAPQLLLCSSAVRTRETLEGIQKGFAVKPSIQFMDTLYHATASSMRAILAQASDAADSIMIVGHNPGMHELADWLANDQGNPRMREALALQFPTASLAALHFEVQSWKELTRGSGELEAFVTPDALMYAV